jgi:FlaG/FlaF family flagellin (archaellin)
MRKIRKIRRDKKGIDTILAALLMVVIVVVAAVMVYAWATGLLSALLVQNPVPKESMNFESFAFNNNNMNLTLSVRNTGSVAIAFASYYVKDSNGNQYARLNWPTDGAGQYPASANPNALVSVNIAISAKCSTSCSTSGTAFTFSSGLSYTVTVVTTRNNQFVWTGTR